MNTKTSPIDLSRSRAIVFFLGAWMAGCSAPQDGGGIVVVPPAADAPAVGARPTDTRAWNMELVGDHDLQGR